MTVFLILAFLFCIGNMLGWGLEVLYRRFVSSANPERKWINPGFLAGPSLPLYGSSLCILYLLAGLESDIRITNPALEKLLLFALMALCITALEYVTGRVCQKRLKISLWDYSDQWGNIRGVICPQFTLYWAVLSAVYYFLIHPHILEALAWLAQNLAFSFVIGVYYGVFIIDVCYSAHLTVTIKQYAEEHQLVVQFEELKAHIRASREERRERMRFLLALRTSQPLAEHLRAYGEKLHERAEAEKERLREQAETEKERLREWY